MRIQLKCDAACSEATLALERIADDYVPPEELIKDFFKQAEALSEELGTILTESAPEVMSRCPAEEDAFRASTPKIIKRAIWALGHLEKKQGQSSECPPRIRDILRMEPDDYQTRTVTERWDRLLLAFLEKQVNRVNLAISEWQSKSSFAVEMEPTFDPKRQTTNPETDHNMIQLQQASVQFNIPKSSLSKAAKKDKGESGYLASRKVGSARYFWKDDLQKFARSRAAFRRKRPPSQND